MLNRPQACNDKEMQAIFCCIGWFVVLPLAGCDQQHSNGANELFNDADRRSRESSVIDAGVVLFDRAGYLCIPQDRVGLPHDATVVSLTSSCDCIKPRVVSFKTPNAGYARGILLEYLPYDHALDRDSGSHSRAHLPMNLGVIVQAELSNAQTHTISVELLRTNLIEESKP